MRILFTADQHITLRKTKVKKEWASNRYGLFFNKLKEIDHDVLILGGDFFDKRPNIEELSLFLHFINNHNKPIYMIAGNHEASTKYATFLTALRPLEKNGKFKLMLNDDDCLTSAGLNINFMTYQYIKAGCNPPPIKKGVSNILVTHARGDLAFAEPEYDFSRFSEYDLVLIGDLHTYHQEALFPNTWYPGSPYTITFHKEQFPHGVFVVDTEKSLVPEFLELDLPQLIKYEIKAGESAPSCREQDCAITEVVGTAAELSKIPKSESVVRKLEVRSEATIPLAGLSSLEKLIAVLDHMGIKNKKKILEAYHEIA